jgi:preprotein translocase subunit SecF
MSEFADDPKSEIQRKGEQLFWIAVLESITYVGLFTCWQIIDTQAGTKLMGWFHGWVAAAFAVMVVWITPGIRWRWWFAVATIATGPFGAVVVAARLRRTDWTKLDALRRSERLAATSR